MVKRRVIKNTTLSEKVDSLSEPAEIFFYRLVMCSDISGNHPAHPKILRSNLFPLKDPTFFTEAHILCCLEECCDNQLVFKYEIDYKKFVHIFDYGQRADREKPKYPGPTPEQMAAVRPPSGADPRSEVEVEKEIELEKEKEKPFLVFPFDNDDFRNAWQVWLEYKKESFNFTFRTLKSHQAALEKIGELANGDQAYAHHMIKRSIENQWQGFFHDNSYYKNVRSNQTGKGDSFDSASLSELHRRTSENGSQGRGKA